MLGLASRRIAELKLETIKINLRAWGFHDIPYVYSIETIKVYLESIGRVVDGIFCCPLP